MTIDDLETPAVVVDLDVLARDVGNELLIPIGNAVEDQTNLLLLPTPAETLGCQEHPEFQGHVESRQSRWLR